MQRTFFTIAVSALGITTAHGQTVLQLNGQTSGSESAVASETLGIPTSPSPSTSSSGPAIGSVGSDPLGVPTSWPGSASSPSSRIEFRCFERIGNDYWISQRWPGGDECRCNDEPPIALTSAG